MAYLETVLTDPEVWVQHQFGIDTMRWNWDLFLEINNWRDRNSNAALRFYSFAWWHVALNTIDALRLLENMLDWKEINIKLKKFIKKVSIKNQEGRLTIEYLKKENRVVFTINQERDDWWDRPCNKKASIVFVLEWSEKSDELVVIVKDNVFKCLANLQHEMLKDFKEEERVRKLNLKNGFNL